MKVFLENFNENSDSGPNGFTKKLFKNLIEKHEVKITSHDDADLSFCLIQETIDINKPRILRLDGIYFNLEQDYQALNNPIRRTYYKSDAVIFQTEFNKKLIESWFGPHKNGNVIRNGTDVELIEKIPSIQNEDLNNFQEIWSCAAAWRPHKRLDENIRYFLEFAPTNACLIIMGKDASPWLIKHPRVFYVGHLSWEHQIMIFKRSKVFLHLAFLDHCPNVVVDARASGCKIICSSSGGTKEIAGKDSIIIEEEDWDFKPLSLYKPPKMNFERIIKNDFDVSINIKEISKNYIDVMSGVCR